MRFSQQLSDTISLELITPNAISDIYELTRKNHTRLREWEPWAQGDPTFETATEYVNRHVEASFQGSSVPCIIYDGHTPIGFIELRIDRARLIGDIGYWLDSEAEGRGIITQACQALIDHGVSLGLKRFELRIATENERSAAVAERLGFTLEGVLKQTTPIKGRRLDTELYAYLIE